MSQVRNGATETRLTGMPLVLLTAVLLAVAALVIYSRQTVAADPRAERAFDPDETMRVTRDAWVSFRPRDVEPATGVIFYPGGKVEPAAYAPILRALAERGMLVALVPMPLNLAILAPDRGADVMRRNPAVRHWFIAGHSFGGVMAARFAFDRRDSLAGLILWAAFPERSVDLADTALPVLSVYGTQDEITAPQEILTARAVLPDGATLAAIEGADHWSFGSFAGVSRRASRSSQELEAAILNATTQFIRTVTGSELTDPEA